LKVSGAVRQLQLTLGV